VLYGLVSIVQPGDKPPGEARPVMSDSVSTVQQDDDPDEDEQRESLPAVKDTVAELHVSFNIITNVTV